MSIKQTELKGLHGLSPVEDWIWNYQILESRNEALSARLTAMEEALREARKDVKFAMGTTEHPTVVRNYLDTILFGINQVLEGK